MLSLIHKLQRKPEAARKRLAVIISASLTGVIVLFWLVNLRVTEAPAAVAVEKAEEGPLGSLTGGVSVLINEMGEMFQEVAGAFSAFTKKTSASEAPPKTPSGE